MSDTTRDMQSICVMGLGYIGLPTASLMATKGFRVHGVDVRPDVVAKINRGDVHIVEPDLDVLVRSAVQSGRLTAALEPAPADVFIIAVPTPFRDGYTPDLGYVQAATEAIAPHVRPGNLVILESTSPVSTTEKIGEWLGAARPELALPRRGEGDGDVFLAHCPERVLPGNILQELVDNDRIIGGINEASTARACELYRSFVHGEILATDSRTAELAKLSENAYRDVNIAYANELANICDDLDINVRDLIRLANHHPRVDILMPGIGVGGHCIPVDPWFIVDAVPEQARLIRTAREINNARPERFVAQILAAAGARPGAPIALLGLAYKPDVDDLRESPACAVAVAVAKRTEHEILIVEPHIEALPPALAGHERVRLCPLDEAIAAAGVIARLVPHRAFEAVTPEARAGRTIVDPVGAW